MVLRLDLTDKLARFPIAYNLQPVRGWPVKHFDTGLDTSLQRTKQQALGEGPWDGVEKLWTDAFEISSGDYIFHPGMGNDLPDANFPSDAPHPWTAYISAKCQAGLTSDQTDALFGIYRTLRTPNFDGDGIQIDSDGDPIGGGDPRDYYFFKPNPANCAVDQLLRWGKRLPGIVNFPAWVDWRDYNDELIDRDNALYTPRSLSLTPTTGGFLVPGTTYYFRVSTIRGADESSASQKTIETVADSILLTGGQTAVQVNWLIKGDEEDPAAPPGDIDEFRVFVGTTAGAWLGYFTVADPDLRTLLVTTVAGVTAGDPLDVASSGLLSQIKRFECGLFFVPPYDLASALDRICQISCADWQWSGLGTETYRNDKVRFLSPATRTPVFTLNLAETGMGSFRTYPVDRRSRPNQVIVNFRDRDDEFLGEAQPVILDREQLQLDEGQVKPFVIDGGTMYRSQAQRDASFYARVLCDMDQMAAMTGSPKSYHVLPADVVYVTNDAPDWTDVQFMVRKKEEKVETSVLGDPFTMQLYTEGLYSDTDHSPLPRPLPVRPFDPFAAAPIATNLVVTVDTEFDTSFTVDFDFTAFHQNQRARIYIKGPVPGLGDPEPDDSTYRQITTVVPNDALEGHYQSPALPPGVYWVKVVTESALGFSEASGHPVESMDLLPLAPTALSSVRDGSLDFFNEADGHPRLSELPASYVFRFTRASDAEFLRDIPVTTGGTMALSFPDVNSLTVDKNNLSTSGSARSAQRVIGPGQFVEFTLPPIDTDDGGSVDLNMIADPEADWLFSPDTKYSVMCTRGLAERGWFCRALDSSEGFGGPTLEFVYGQKQIITNATNASPIIVTSEKHGLVTGQDIRISLVTGNTAANDFWEVTVIDEDTFSLNSSTGSGAYVSGGIIEALSYPVGDGPVAIRAVFVGTEVRFYKNWTLGRKPFAISHKDSTDQFPMKVRVQLQAFGVGFIDVRNLVMGTSPDPQTIYSISQQEADLLKIGETAATAAMGIDVTDLGIELWQTSTYPNTRGTSVSGVF